ncbi:hypothetical protein [Spongiactinospora rosea]|uniref:hypothetical protein n=1 Tax=Spongiactinospora rosea TaxID=2248750 RepID=UPI0018F31FA4|nr:hypothetical protein [Spongiactinospora rosea]
MTNNLAPTAVSQFLASQAWELESRQDHIREIWRLSDARHGAVARIMLPLATDFADFAERFYDALRAIGRVNGWDADRLYEHIVAARADRLFIGLDQAAADGTIPFKQAETTINAIYRMLRAAATTAADPSHSHRGRRSATVTDFLDEGVRLGHTKRGSYVFTVVTRLDLDEMQPTAPIEADRGKVKPFSRRVMTTLARGLQTTDDLARGHARESLVDPAAYGLSASLLESLEEIAQPPALRALNLSFDWAFGMDAPDVRAGTITLRREAFPAISRVRERLARQEEPPRRERLVGPVKSLTREELDDPSDEAATIVILADVNGRTRNVHIPLAGENHDWAIRAYKSKLPLTVIGDLVYERRAWKLQGDIDLDTSFLRYTLGDRPED